MITPIAARALHRSRTATIWANSAWNTVGYGISVLVLLVTTPIFVRSLGLERFGLFGLLATVTGPLSVLNAGIAQATVKYVAEYSHTSDEDRLGGYIGSSIAINVGVGLAGCVALMLLAGWVTRHVFLIPPALVDESIAAIRLTGLVWLAAQSSEVLRAVLEGVQAFKAVAVVTALRTAAWGAGGAALLLYSPSLVRLVLFQVLLETAVVITLAVLVKRTLPRCSLMPAWDPDSGRLALRFSSWQMMSALVGNAAGYGDRPLLAAVSGLQSTGVYSIAVRIINLLRGISSNVVRALYPALSRASATHGESERTVLSEGRLISAVSIAVYAAVFACAPEVMTLWLGDAVGSPVGHLLRILLLTLALELPGAMIQAYLLGNGLSRPVSLNSMGVALVTVAAMVVLGLRYGAVGVAWSGLAGLVLVRVPFHVAIFRSRFRQTVGVNRALWDTYGVLVDGPVAASIGLGVLYLTKSMVGSGYAAKLLGPGLAILSAVGTVAAIELVVWQARRSSGRVDPVCRHDDSVRAARRPI
jgi:O-antigen/teichoic acid export membrane protein